MAEYVDPPEDAGTAQPEFVGTSWRNFAPLTLDPPLAAALSTFLEFGYHGSSIRRIAQRAGLSVPGLYHYYASKQEMLVSIFDLTMEDLLARTTAARAHGQSTVERFALVVECLALYHTHRWELGFVGASEMRSLEGAARDRVVAARRRQQTMIDELVEHAATDGLFTTKHPHEAARAVVTLCTALPQWFRKDGPASAEEVAEQYVRFGFSLVGWQGDAVRPAL